MSGENTIYFDCFSGISGDMTLGALIGLGVDVQILRAELAKLGLSGYELEVSYVDRCGIRAVRCEVKVDADEQADHHEHHHGRRLDEICKLISDSTLPQRVKERATAIFSKLAVAEGKVHGVSPQEVHFHEVGAVDAIVDIVGACIGFELLGISNFICSPLRVGFGQIRCAHGVYPIPAPGTAELLNGIPIYAGNLEGEFVTPTGASIVSTLCSEFGEVDFVPQRIGYGAGSRTYDGFPNVLRLILGRKRTGCTNSTVIVIEANIDDCNPQVFGYLMEQLFEVGALDVYYTPIQMKKSRPAVLLTALVEASNFDRVANCILSETTTIGLRYYEAKRRVLERHVETVETKYGAINFKLATEGGRILNSMPEYRDCLVAAKRHGVTLTEVQKEALVAFEESRKKK
ncbi:MAG: nickel pincer cofactor biosynthesis protein LarC [Acidobacteriota bacterium]|nr:nickel pincer cofactor biosynthesis protein LarC [Blastocatellia bacterium]MDW8412025.1 nickel pincer cofactor biosynthesis protein LarC [Acidobacteriota bacterium]